MTVAPAAFGDNRPIIVALLFIVLILISGTVYTMTTQGTAPLLSVGYLLQQFQIGSFLGIVAAGLMVVILLGHIDLSVAWTLTAAAIIATSVGGPWAIPVGIGVGVAVGVFNGIGVGYLRVPSMIFTLGVDAVLRGLMVAFTGDSASPTGATTLMRFLSSGTLLGIPNALIVWAFVSLIIATTLRETPFGRYVYAIGNREQAVYLSGVKTRRVVLLAFVISGACAGLAGVMLAGYTAKAYQGMGNAYVLPAIAAVIVGGTSILGGSGRYSGTIVGVMLIVLLNSILSIMQMPEAGRQIIYGLVIIVMLLAYRRKQQLQ